MKSLFELHRYPFDARQIQGAPREAGVYVLWEGTEVTYIGTAEPDVMTIKQRLLDHLSGHNHCSCRPTHYSWRLSRNPGIVERELLGQYRHKLAASPRCNQAGLHKG
jgi:hypothetical protein